MKTTKFKIFALLFLITLTIHSLAQSPVKKRTCLIIGRKNIVVDDVSRHITAKNVTFYTAINLEQVKDIFNRHNIDVVAMGAGIDLPARLDIIKYIFETSDTTSVYLKDKASGPGGMLPFLNQILNASAEPGNK